MTRKPGLKLLEVEHELPAGKLVFLNPGTRSTAMLSLVSVFAMIPAEVRGWGGGWSNTGSRARLRMLAEGIDKIILIRKRWRSGEVAVFCYQSVDNKARFNYK